jgi:hypothetical protein
MQVDQRYNRWRARFSNTISLGQKIKLSINGYYNSNVLDAQGEVSKNYWVYVSLSTPVFKSQGNLSLDMQDVFGTGKHNTTRTGDGFTSSLDMRTPRMIVGLNVSYKFNNLRNKTSRFGFED